MKRSKVFHKFGGRGKAPGMGLTENKTGPGKPGSARISGADGRAARTRGGNDNRRTPLVLLPGNRHPLGRPGPPGAAASASAPGQSKLSGRGHGIHGALTTSGLSLQLQMRLVLPPTAISIHKSNELGLLVGLEEL